MTSQRWFIVTNTDNLKFFYDCSLIVDRQAFPENSYMHDMQAERPKGFLPCFSEENLSEALESANREDENLITCLVEIELKGIKFEQFYAQIRNRSSGEFERVAGENLAKLDAIEVLLPSPLPLSCIKSIFLSDAKTQKAVAQEFSSSFGEFSPKFFNCNAKLFKDQSPQTKDLVSEADQFRGALQLEDIPDRELSYTKAFAYGGALTLSYYQTKNCLRSSERFEAFANNKLETAEYSHLAPLVSWVFSNESDSELAELYFLIFNLIAAEDELGTVHYDLLNLFENKEKLPPGYAHVSGLAYRLRQLVERTYEDDLDTYFSKLIEASESKSEWSSKIFLLISLIFIRDNSETLLKFYHERFTEEDYFLSAIFFGLARGIRNVPLEVRNITGLRGWVSYKMTELMHQNYREDMTLGNEPSPPVLIHKKYLKKSRIPKIQDALQKFCKFVDVDENEIIVWTLNTRNEYKVQPGVITFLERPALYAEVDHDRLESLMLVKSIKESDELFDFNKVFKIFKG